MNKIEKRASYPHVLVQQPGCEGREFRKENGDKKSIGVPARIESPTLKMGAGKAAIPTLLSSARELTPNWPDSGWKPCKVCPPCRPESEMFAILGCTAPNEQGLDELESDRGDPSGYAKWEQERANRLDRVRREVGSPINRRVRVRRREIEGYVRED